jgi:hypothetical protein
MCISIEYEKEYGICFDQLRMDIGQGWENTIQAFLLKNDILVTDEEIFGRKFLDFLEEMHKSKLICPGAS